jgi:hypothetical protein
MNQIDQKTDDNGLPLVIPVEPRWWALLPSMVIVCLGSGAVMMSACSNVAVSDAY